MVINGSSSSKIADDKALMYPYIDYTNSNFIDNLPKNKENNILILGAGGFTIGLNDVRNHYVFFRCNRATSTHIGGTFFTSKLDRQ